MTFMRVALAILARPVEMFLISAVKHVEPYFDGTLILTEKGRTWQFPANNRRHIFDDYVWDHDASNARTILIDHAVSLGYDGIFFLDADESLLEKQVSHLRCYMETEECLIFSRYEFVDDVDHFLPSVYPDYQPRAFRLGIGYHFRGKVHEVLCKYGQPALQSPSSTFIPNIPIFHYGRCKDPKDVWLKGNRYQRLAEGREPFIEIPNDLKLPKSFAYGLKKIRFIGEKPL